MLKMYLDNMHKTCCDVRYRIVITDINMPRMDGIEASERILNEQRRIQKERPETPEVMIVALTAYDTEMNVKRCNEAGIENCLSKPLKPDQLGFIVNNHSKMQMKN